MNLRLDIEYDGSLYCGWQVQPNGRSVQQEIEKALSTVLRRNVTVVGAGRTDAGVHALGQVAHFHVEGDGPCSLQSLQRSLNGLLREGITIHRVRRVPDSFHARYSAKERTYAYSIATRKCSIDRNRFFFFFQPLDLRAMQKAAKKLLGRHDFKNLSIATGEKSTLCHVKRIALTKKGAVISLTITADRYLHKMVRMIVGLLINVGRRKVSLSAMDRIFTAGPVVKKMAFCAPAQGLCLVKVSYK